MRSGFTSPNLLEAEINRAIVETARLLLVVADHAKWDLVDLSSFARLDQADTLITSSRSASPDLETPGWHVR